MACWGPSRRSRGFLALLLGFMAVLLIMGVLATCFPTAAAAARPGETDPAAGFSEWPDDEIYLTTPLLAGSTPARSYSRVYEASSDLGKLTLKEEVQYAVATDQHDAIAVAAGRFLSPEKESVAQAYRNGSGIDVRMLKLPVSATLTSLANRAPGCTDFFDIAAGDLDGLLWDWERRDEVVVAYAQPGGNNKYPVRVVVLDLGAASESSPAATAQTAATAAGTLDGASILAAAILPLDNALAVATGDFDGNGLDEIAVAYLSGPSSLTIEIFRYSATRNSTGHVTRSLEPLATGSIELATVTKWLANLSAAAGDLNGDGRDELALGTANYVDGDIHEHVRVISFVEAPSGLTVRPTTITDLRSGAAQNTTGRVEVAAGLFRFDPANQFDLQRRQIAVAYSHLDNVVLRTIEYQSDLTDTLSPPVNLPGKPAVFSLATGRFQGPVTATNGDPSWSVAAISWDGASNVCSLALFQTASGAAPTLRSQLQYTTPTPPYSAGNRLGLTAFDYDGDNMFLGAPVHFTVQDLVNADFILQEPPKHAYYDEAEEEVVNVSRSDDFHISLTSTAGKTVEASSKDTASYALGHSREWSAGGTAGGGINIGILKLGAEVTTEFDSTLKNDYSKNQSYYNSSYQESSYTFTANTNRDDYVVAQMQIYDIWRYRIYGMEADSETYPFMDFILPGPVSGQRVQSGGLNLDWYQPVHENGNILSYPQHSPYLPPDLGSYTLPNESVFKGLMYGGNVLSFFDGNSDSTSLQWSSASGGGSERSYSRTLSKSSSLKITAKVTAEIFSANLSASGSYAIGSSEDNSWGDTKTSDVKVSNSTGFVLNKPAGDSSKAYGFYPLIYTTNDGTMKATYYVDPLASEYGKYWWLENYGLKPDLALNLPLRFLATSGDWVPNERDTRKKMRGFFVKGYDDQAQTYYDVRSSALLQNQTVTLQARVYNYAVENGATTVVPDDAKVRFSYVPFDASSYSEVGARVPIGETTLLQPLPAQQMTTVSMEWTPPSLGAEVSKQQYRIYVELDPDDDIDEKYETEAAGDLDPGQNNEGYSDVTVVKSALAGSGDSEPGDVGIGPDTMTVVNADGEVVGGDVAAYRDEPLRVGVMVTSDKASLESSYVLLYDGDPDQDGVLIGIQEVFTGDPEGTTVWFDWMPTLEGSHHLYSKVLQSVHDTAPGNNVGVLEIIILEREQGEPGPFTDVPSDHAYATAINELAQREIILGKGGGLFAPDESMTRQQFAKTIVKTLGLTVTGTETCPFADVEEQMGEDLFYPSKYVAVCANEGITRGLTATIFAPYDPISRQQLITMVTRAAKLPDPPADYVPTFTADQFYPEEHYLNARKAAYAGLLEGLVGIAPPYDFLTSSTRGECAQLLYNLIVFKES